MIDNNSIRTLICPKEKWVNDNDATFCFGCQKEFRPIIRWKHHCRFCGNVFCSNCSKFFIYGDSINYKEERKLRHCEPCHIKINQFSSQEQKDYNRKTHLFDSNEKMIVIEVDETQTSGFTVDEPDFVVKQTQINDNFFINALQSLSHSLCEKNQLQCSIWAKRLAELAWKTSDETKIDTFIKKEYLNILKEIRIVMIKTPKDAVTAACVKGLILQRNIPSKQLDTHIKFPRILTVKPAIQADGLIKSSEVKFDEMIKNENIILKNYLQKIFRIHPNVIFVEEHVSKVAFEYFLTNKIMVISKVKEQDMEIIEKLSSIKRRIDNLLFVDRFRVDDLLGVCDRIYFKTIKQGEMLMFIEHQSGIRSVLLGDYTDEINFNLKKTFETLLKMAWNMKKQKEIMYRDLKIKYTFNQSDQSVFYDTPIREKYASIDSFATSQEIVSTKAIYKHCKTIELNKNYYQYCCRYNRTHFLERCDDSLCSKIKLYSGEDIYLGSYLLQSVINSENRCKKCGYYHAERFYIDEYCVTILIDNYIERKGAYYNPRTQQAEEQEQEKIQQKQSMAEYNNILKYFKNFQQKLFFKLFFKCDDCGMIVGNAKTKIGQQYLTITLMHYISELINNFKRKQSIERTSSAIIEECLHKNIFRIIQCPYILIKFDVSRVEKYQLLPIIFSQAMVKLTLLKDEKMIHDLYKQQIAQKYCCLENLDVELKMMPFYVSGSTSSFISFSGMSAKANGYSTHFEKMIDILQKLKQNLTQVERQIPKYFEESSHDWTIVMRKIYKIQHVLKLMIEATNHLNNILKKEKIQQSLSNFEELANSTQMASFEDKQGKIRKYSEQKSQNEFLFKSQSIAATLNLQNSIRKDTSLEIESQIDTFQKKLRKQRFLRYRGVFMYFPIGNIYDPVSILACCLNSEEFNVYLNEDKVRDQISIKIPFFKTLKTQWGISLEMEKIYRQLYRQDYDKNESYQFQFSIYYHKQFEELRQDEGINFKLFVRSLYGCQNWDSSGGKSNSTFSKSHNEILVVKIINEKEFIQFQKFAPAYLKYMKAKRQRNQSSYLAKIYGIYEANIRNKIYKFVVMQNIFFGMNGSMKVYDLKGSEVNRLAMPTGEKSFTGLDTNFVIDKDGKPYLLQPSIYDKTIRILEEDANFLREQAVIDYSLLVIQSQLTLRMGIIDFMRPYHLIQKIQTLYKQIKSGKDPTVIPPLQYSERFVSAMKKYFAKPPS